MKRRKRIRIGLASVAALAVTGVGWQVWASDGDGSANYRWATTSTATVTTSTSMSGTVQPAARAELQYGTNGTVADVKVADGDTVARGQVLVALDTAALKRKVRAAESELTIAQAALAAHEDGQQALVSSAASAGSGESIARSSVSPSSTGTSGSVTTVAAVHRTSASNTSSVHTVASSSDVTSALSQVTAQQAAVKTAQTNVSAAQQVAQTALSAQQTACGAAYTNNTANDAAVNQACDDALAAVQAAQADVTTRQDALSTALDDLGSTLTAAAATLQQATDDLAAAEAEVEDNPFGSSTPSSGSSSGTTPESSGSSGDKPTGTPGQAGQAPSSGTGQSGTTSGGSGGTSSTTITAAQLASDQADVDAAKADLVAAQQNLAGAQVKAPWGGTIASVSSVEGDSASSGGTAVVLVAPGTTTVEVDASSTQIRKLTVGQSAEVTPAGASKPIAATVATVSRDSAGGSTFPVVLTLDESTATASGTPASVSVVTGTAQDAVTVPTSAVSNGQVRVRDGDSTTTRKVTLGLVGTSLTEITDGLATGDEVALADLSAEVSGAGTINTVDRGFGGGRPGGRGSMPTFPSGGMPAR